MANMFNKGSDLCIRIQNPLVLKATKAKTYDEKRRFYFYRTRISC